MIDFSKATFLKLRPADDYEFSYVLRPMLVRGEFILSCYKSVRDGVVFTNYRIIAINYQGVTGKKKDFTSLPYNNIQAYSVETSGILDMDCELDLWFSGLGKVRFEFISTMNMGDICKLISERALNIPPEPTREPPQNNYKKPEHREPEQIVSPPFDGYAKQKSAPTTYCRHCYKIIDGSPETCPNCGKRLK